MNNTPIFLLLGVALIAYATTRANNKTKQTAFLQSQAWQKAVGVTAIILALLIILNPESLALGLLGDTAFFEMLALALGLQMHGYATLACRWFIATVTKAARWAGIPSPGLCYLLAVSTVAIGNAVSAIQKNMHRILS